MKTIPLTQGKVALVDDEDYYYLMQWKWFYCLGYAKSTRKVGKSLILMHRLILNILDKPECISDHINRNRLDNRRTNLRICTRTENNRNVTSYGEVKYLGVVNYKSKYKNKMYYYIRAQITVNKKKMHLGSFRTLEEAARAYDRVAKKYFGEFANLNFKE